MTSGAQTGLEKPVEHVLAFDGGSQSSLWCQVIADIMQRPVWVTKETESTRLGARMLAAAAVGMHGSIKEATVTGIGVHYEPDEGRAAVYDWLYDAYKEVYPSLRSPLPEAHRSAQARDTQGEGVA